ncbi:MAG TPA: polysaccharide deacetylase family protein [Candidatus Nitrosopolaris sp.]|nr:polysaccharide deacetylase family protein [Candidatus Nitrosopolaris sp.]
MKLNELMNKFKRGTSLAAAAAFATTILATNVATVAAAPVLPTPRISFTFDDGLTSADANAAPILAKYGFAGTDFVISGCVGMSTTPNTCHANNDASYMTWAQINDLKNTYHWEIGSHTVDHACLASNATADPDDCSAPYGGLTPAQVNSELTTSALTIGSNVGVTPTDFATPYGDWTPPVLAQIAAVYASHRGFADSIDQNGDGVIDHGNTYPYNDYLLYDYQVQGDTAGGGVSVAQVESMINQTITNNQWLILTMHDILPNASTNPADYQYSTTNLDAICAYIKSLNIPVVTINQGLVTNTGNLLPNSSFDTALSSNTTDTTSWSTDDPTDIHQDTGGNGNYPSPANSVVLNGTTKDIHLFSPQVPIVGTKTYVLKNYLNVTNMTVAAGHEIDFYIDEYDASGNYLQTKFMKSEVGDSAELNGAWVEELAFTYTPTNATVAKARLQLVVTANSGAKAYLDNSQWFAEDGSTTGGTGSGSAVAGDVNGDGMVNALDLSILLSHWNSSGATLATGDLNGDGTVNALDLSILLTNWGK